MPVSIPLMRYVHDTRGTWHVKNTKASEVFGKSISLVVGVAWCGVAWRDASVTRRTQGDGKNARNMQRKLYTGVGEAGLRNCCWELLPTSRQQQQDTATAATATGLSQQQ